MVELRREGDPDKAEGTQGVTGEEATAQITLKDRNVVLGAALENTRQGISLFDRHLRLVICNRRFLELFGLPENFGQPDTPFEAFVRFNAERGEYGQGDIDQLVAERVELARRFLPHAFERVRPDGTVLEIQGGPVPGIGFIATFTDVTEMRRVQEALEHEQKETRRVLRQLKTTLDNMNQGISLFNEDLVLLVCNQRFAELLRFPAELCHEGTPFEAFIRYNAERGEYGAGDIEDLVRERMELARKFQPHCFERVRPDGVVLEIHGRPVPGVGFVSTYTDVTETRRAQRALEKEKEETQQLLARLEATHGQLLQSEKMASIGQLAAGVAHEINNPIGFVKSNISTLKGYVTNLLAIVTAYERMEAKLAGAGLGEDLAEMQALKERCDLDYLKEDIPQLVAETTEGIGRVQDIVLDLKEFSHVDKSEWHFADLHKGLESTIKIAWNELKYKAEIVREYGQLPEVECIASQINQVFLNLLVNAAHAIEARGTITVRSGVRDERVWIEIEDTGQGIAREQLARIFDPFYTTKAVGQGTGLGLSLSYGIVQNHSGTIDVTSRVGHGTTFRITLPMRKPD